LGIKKAPHVLIENNIGIYALFSTANFGESTMHGEFKDSDVDDVRQREIAIWPSKPELLISAKA